MRKVVNEFSENWKNELIRSPVKLGELKKKKMKKLAVTVKVNSSSGIMPNLDENK